jgi:hypothetical protein
MDYSQLRLKLNDHLHDVSAVIGVSYRALPTEGYYEWQVWEARDIGLPAPD